MTLAAWAYGDEEGISTYPELLGNWAGAKLLHIYDSSPESMHRALCGTVLDGPVEYIGRRDGQKIPRRPVCRLCRAKADERT